MARKARKDSDSSEPRADSSPQRPGTRERRKPAASLMQEPASSAKAKSQERAKAQEKTQSQQHAGRAAVAQEAGTHATHEQIQEKARAIWHARGCPSGQDLEIWFEAEKALGR